MSCNYQSVCRIVICDLPSDLPGPASPRHCPCRDMQAGNNSYLQLRDINEVRFHIKISGGQHKNDIR